MRGIGLIQLRIGRALVNAALNLRVPLAMELVSMSYKHYVLKYLICFTENIVRDTTLPKSDYKLHKILFMYLHTVQLFSNLRGEKS